MITCKDCGKLVKRKGGSQKWCPDCSRRKMLARRVRYRARNREAIREYNAKYEAEHREARRKYHAKYEAEHREARRKYNADRDHRSFATREYRRMWHRENPGKAALYKKKGKDRDSAVRASRNRSRWTAAEDAVVMSWTESYRELGAVLGRTRYAVSQRRRVLLKRASGQPIDSKEQP